MLIMSTQSAILEEQRKRVSYRKWSDSYGDYLADYNDNLILPLHPQVLAAYAAGAGAELPPKYDDELQRWYRWNRSQPVPAKLQAIHSSSALVCNAFGYWYNQTDRSPLEKALGCTSCIESLKFEDKMPTGLGGIPPHLDVSLYCDRKPYLVESKFTECYQEKKTMKMGSRSYSCSVWREKGLVACGELVDKINRGEMDGRFNFLDAPQLLKHILGLKNSHGSNFELVYLWFDMPGFREAERHREEISLFEILLGGEVSFKALTYRQLFDGITANSGGNHKDYLDKFAARYL